MLARGLLGGAAFLALSVMGHAHEADGHGYPGLHIILPIELQFDATFDADDPLAEINDLYLTIEPEVHFELNEWLTVEMGLVFEPVLDPAPGDDRAFEDHGLFLETIQAVGSFGKITVNLGKFAAPFAIGYDYAPGVYGDTLNEEIEVAERLGIGGAYNFTGEGADKGVILRAALFSRDTTFLSGSAFANRGRLFETDGGNGNTEGLENFSVALDLLNLDSLPDFHVRFAYMHQAAGLGDLSDQNAYTAGVNWQKDIGKGVVYQVLAEWAHSDGALGYGDALSAPGASQDDFTLAASGTWHSKWTAATGVSFRDIDDPIGGDVETTAFHLSAGYYVTGTLLAEIAYLNVNEDGNDSQTLGLKLSTGFEWEAH